MAHRAVLAQPHTKCALSTKTVCRVIFEKSPPHIDYITLTALGTLYN